jgi:hypothetical protein
MSARDERFGLRFDARGDRLQELGSFFARHACEKGAGFGGELDGEVNFFARCGVKGRLDFLAGGWSEGLERAVPCDARVAVAKSDY